MQESVLARISNLSMSLKEALEGGAFEWREYISWQLCEGDYLKLSDIDLVVVSDDWENGQFLKRLDIVEKMVWAQGLENVETIPMATRELKEKSYVVLRDAAEYWIKVL